MDKNKLDNLKIVTYNTDKFKTTKLSIYFTLKSDERNFAKMAMLSELLGNATEKYISETEVSRQLSRMFGASFGVTVLRYGDIHTLRVNVSFPNDKYLPDNQHVGAEIINFLDEVINHPLVENNQFESNFFDLHKANLLNYLNSIIEDREYYANIQLQKLMFPNDANHGSFLYGTAEQLEALDSSTIYQFYQWLLTNANIMAFIGGNTSDELVDQLSNILPKANHKFEQLKPFVKLPQSNQVFRDEKILDIEQTILTMGYELPVYSGDQLYYPAVILNQLLGGSPQSILFTDVREKQGLAYDISSSYNSLNGSLTVSAGILPQNQALVENLVAESIHKIMGGQIDQQVIAGIKQSLIDQRKSSADSLGSQIGKLFIHEIIGTNVDDASYIAGINAVSINEIIELAKRLKLRAIYSLKGSDEIDADN